MSFTEDRQLVGTADVQFNCPTCDTTNLVDALRFKTVDRWLGTIPCWVTYETAIKCPGCDATFRSGADLEELALLSPEQISTRFKLRIGLVEKFLVITGWLLVYTGPLSLALFVYAWFTVPKATRGWRRAVKIGVAVSLLFTLFFVYCVFAAP